MSFPFAQMNLSAKIPAIAVTSAFLAALVVGLASYVMMRSDTIELASEEMATLADENGTIIKNYFEAISRNIAFVGGTPTTAQAVVRFSDAWRRIEGDPLTVLQSAYITDNPHPTGRKDKLYDADDGSAYSGIHAAYHPWFHKLQQREGYYDIFLFDLDGNLIYSVFKELDYATNLNSGEWKDTDLGNAFRAAAASDEPGSVHFLIFVPMLRARMRRQVSCRRRFSTSKARRSGFWHSRCRSTG